MQVEMDSMTGLYILLSGPIEQIWGWGCGLMAEHLHKVLGLIPTSKTGWVWRRNLELKANLKECNLYLPESLDRLLGFLRV
jgi:hypothetical protein